MKPLLMSSSAYSPNLPHSKGLLLLMLVPGREGREGPNNIYLLVYTEMPGYFVCNVRVKMA